MRKITHNEPHPIASIIRDYPRIPESAKPPYLDPEIQALLEDIGNGEEKTILFEQLKPILTWLSPDIISLIVDYNFFFLWLEWAACLQPVLDQLERYSLFTQWMIRNFFILLISLDKKPDQQIVLQYRFRKQRNIDLSDFTHFENPHAAAELLISKGYKNFYLQDMLKEVGLEQKSNALLQETLLQIGGYEKFTLKQSDFHLLSQIYKNSYYKKKFYWEGEVETFPQLLRFFNNPSCTSSPIPFFSEEKGKMYSVIASGNKPLSKVLSNLPLLEQEWLEFQKIRAEPLGTKTFDLINELIIFPTVLCQTICSYLYLQPTQTGFDLAKETYILIDHIPAQDLRDMERHIPQFSDYLVKALWAISNQNSLVVDIHYYEQDKLYYPNPLKVIADLAEDRVRVTEIPLRKRFRLMEYLGKLNERLPDQEAIVWAVELKIKIIQMVNFYQAYTREVSPYRSELFQKSKNTPPSRTVAPDSFALRR